MFHNSSSTHYNFQDKQKNSNQVELSKAVDAYLIAGSSQQIDSHKINIHKEYYNSYLMK